MTLMRPCAAWSLLVACVLCFASPSRAATPTVIVTIDVESKTNLPLTAQIDSVCDDGRPCGLTEVMQRLKSHGVRGTFFVNVYEHATLGTSRIRDIVRLLVSQGHDVELHTHPETAYDPLRPEMYQYNRAEQATIIREGAELLRRWTGQNVIAHRAGDYSANSETLAALRDNGIRIDSSFFPGHPSCRLDAETFRANQPTLCQTILEIPVTVYWRQERPRGLGMLFRPHVSLRKLDADWFSDEKEAGDAVRAALRMETPYVVMFLHSFSFIETPGRNGVPTANRRAERILDTMLNSVAASQASFATMRDVSISRTASPGANVVAGDSSIPAIPVLAPVPHYVWHRLHAAATTAGLQLRLLVLGSVIVTGTLAALARTYRRRRFLEISN